MTESAMIALYVSLGIAVLVLLALLLWFVPHLLHQQAMRSSGEAAQLREMLLDMLSEQEAVTSRQAQLGTSLSYLQDRVEHLVVQGGARGEQGSAPVVVQSDPEAIRQVEERLVELQQQIQIWIDSRGDVARRKVAQDNEAWANLMGLLASIQDRVGSISTEHGQQARINVHAGVLLEELEQEMQNLRSISEEIATLQWRLRRSLHERETNLSVLRQRTLSTANGTRG